ncbi:MAG: nucleoid-associated protein, YbaB/EbfC family [Acidobacteria bacterium RIFCSPHIGHO2_12_FULL_67_30]|nr:MAG: nucleoid-associated protein, YbaB/EbfC family [Acidobacteria bacterium RIFCSPHIGHO2_02_FULL_67_57]OFV84781.1 MAG: nucleoid-associated protein, YbaB/EbfC family [Acidobacteria bacterium RIFCSPHIGHO2_01_FULL_67_28]OFV87069.1 MAG: nucleoid-associated protein, YbaB/EbfC family [Acidobacteria bacterium RIFCSPHIGHO2_12_FULL_67_30]
MPDLKQMLTQVKQMQEQLQQRLERLTVEASAGGGMVSVKMNGQKQLLEVRIEPAVLESADREMLQDLVLAAVNEAGRRVDAELQQQVSTLAGGINPFKIPGLF